MLGPCPVFLCCVPAHLSLLPSHPAPGTSSRPSTPLREGVSLAGPLLRVGPGPPSCLYCPLSRAVHSHLVTSHPPITDSRMWPSTPSPAPRVWRGRTSDPPRGHLTCRGTQTSDKCTGSTRFSPGLSHAPSRPLRQPPWPPSESFRGRVPCSALRPPPPLTDACPPLTSAQAFLLQGHSLGGRRPSSRSVWPVPTTRPSPALSRAPAGGVRRGASSTYRWGSKWTRVGAVTFRARREAPVAVLSLPAHVSHRSFLRVSDGLGVRTTGRCRQQPLSLEDSDLSAGNRASPSRRQTWNWNCSQHGAYPAGDHPRVRESGRASWMRQPPSSDLGEAADVQRRASPRGFAPGASLGAGGSEER